MILTQNQMRDELIEEVIETLVTRSYNQIYINQNLLFVTNERVMLEDGGNDGTKFEYDTKSGSQDTKTIEDPP